MGMETDQAEQLDALLSQPMKALNKNQQGEKMYATNTSKQEK